MQVQQRNVMKSFALLTVSFPLKCPLGECQKRDVTRNDLRERWCFAYNKEGAGMGRRRLGEGYGNGAGKSMSYNVVKEGTMYSHS